MSKIRKQMVINLLLVIASGAVIVLAKSIPAGKLLPYGEYLGSDIVFVVISALVGTMGWRYVEEIHSWWWNLVSIVSLIAFSVFYGAAIAILNDFVKSLILGTLIAFPILYIKENVMIYRHFQREQFSRKQGQSGNYLGYKYRDHND